MESLKEKVQQFENLDKEIRSFLYPKLYKLLLEGKINDGKYNKNKKPDEILTIREFLLNKENIIVCVELHWAGDVYDADSLSMTHQEWENV